MTENTIWRQTAIEALDDAEKLRVSIKELTQAVVTHIEKYNLLEQKCKDLEAEVDKQKTTMSLMAEAITAQIKLETARKEVEKPKPSALEILKEIRKNHQPKDDRDWDRPGRPVYYLNTRYDSMSAASRATGLDRYWIRRHCTHGHPDWRYE